MSDHPTPPSGESAPPSLEERDREAVRRMAARIVSEGQPWRFAVPGNVELLAAEVARLTAEREDHGPNGRNVTNAQHQAMRERAQAAEERAARLHGFVREIAADDPDGIDAYEEATCKYCHQGYKSEGPDWRIILLHSDDCLWMRARALTGGADR